MTQPRRILIIGGGISGLSSAFVFNKPVRCTYHRCEAAPHFGGAIRSERREEPGFNGSWLLEPGRFDDSHQTAGPRLLDDLGLGDIAIPPCQPHAVALSQKAIICTRAGRPLFISSWEIITIRAQPNCQLARQIAHGIRSADSTPWCT